MISIYKKTFNGWATMYDPYADKFQIFDESVFKTDGSKLSEKKCGQYRFVYQKDNSAPMLIEVSRAYSIYGSKIESTNKKDIVNLILPDIKKII
jgi:hypothetical protein